MVIVLDRIEYGKDTHGLDIIPLRRPDIQKSRLRVRTKSGVDVGIALPRGTILHHGDVLSGDGHYMMIEQVPELVGVIRAISDVTPQMWGLMGHVIGNMHRPISANDGGTIVVPLQDVSEVGTFKSIVERIGPECFDVTCEERVFVPHVVADVRRHGG